MNYRTFLLKKKQERREINENIRNHHVFLIEQNKGNRLKTKRLMFKSVTMNNKSKSNTSEHVKYTQKIALILRYTKKKQN